MTPVLSIAIPAHNEEKYIGGCIESVLSSAQHSGHEVEVVVALNRCSDRTQTIAESLGAICTVENRRSIGAVRNAAIHACRAPAIATLDADDRLEQGTIAEVIEHVYDGRFIGGGSLIQLERWSLGICCSCLVALPYLLPHAISAGMFWFRREAFERIAGFDERLASAEDLDFALRLRELGRKLGKEYGTIWRSGIIKSCRKFDRFGDWHLVLNPQLVRAIFAQTDRRGVDPYYYDVSR